MADAIGKAQEIVEYADQVGTVMPDPMLCCMATRMAPIGCIAPVVLAVWKRQRYQQAFILQER